MFAGTNPQQVAALRAPSPVSFFRGLRTDYMVSPGGGRPSPQAYLVEQEAGFSLRPHFHQSHQFQVVVAGCGTLGVHELTPQTVHYASLEAGYGPIVAGPQGLHYFTLRAVTDHSAAPLPQERHRMRPGLVKKQCTVTAPSGGWAAGRSCGLREIIAPDEAGLAAWSSGAGPATAVPLPPTLAGACRFYLVVAGGVQGEAGTFATGAVLFATSDAAPVLSATEDGTHLLVLQFPPQALDD